MEGGNRDEVNSRSLRGKRATERDRKRRDVNFNTMKEW
jgi:hypothetical protein